MSLPRAATLQEYAGARVRAREFGPFFDSTGAVEGAGFTPVARLDAARIRALGHQVGVRLGTGEARVGISTWQFGVMARICSVAVGMLVAGAVMPDLAQVSLDEHNRVGLPREEGWYAATPDEAVDVFVRQLTDSIDLLHHLIHHASGVALGLLRGNTAAAIVAAARAALAGHEPGPVLTGSVVDRIVSSSPLAATMSGSFPHPRRRTCCLFYRAPGGGLCGDCSLSRPDRRTR